MALDNSYNKNNYLKMAWDNWGADTGKASCPVKFKIV